MLATQLSGCPWNSLIMVLGHSKIKSMELSEYRLPGSCYLSSRAPGEGLSLPRQQRLSESPRVAMPGPQKGHWRLENEWTDR